MYSYLKGRYDKKTSDSIILEVGGIGYRIFAPSGTLMSPIQPGTELKLYTHLYVREDNIALYGFISEEELKMFEQLLSVSGVGPKASLALVSVVPAAEFALAVITDDADRFVKAPGIGKKTALRIILELKDKLRKEQLDIPAAKGNGLMPSEPGKDTRITEAISALVMLGYTSMEASKAVAGVFSDAKTVEQIIKDSLKQMGSML